MPNETQNFNHPPTPAPLSFNIKLERNSKGYNWEITVINAPSVDVAIEQITTADTRLRTQYNATT